jgi:hypothetical protein
MTKRHQVKSKYYYWFWGIATVSVVAGQIYVGTGYRHMASAIESIVSAIGNIDVTLIIPEDDSLLREVGAPAGTDPNSEAEV